MKLNSAIKTRKGVFTPMTVTEKFAQNLKNPTRVPANIVASAPFSFALGQKAPNRNIQKTRGA